VAQENRNRQRATDYQKARARKYKGAVIAAVPGPKESEARANLFRAVGVNFVNSAAGPVLFSGPAALFCAVSLP
jgi:hypothetical protein